MTRVTRKVLRPRGGWDKLRQRKYLNNTVEQDHHRSEAEGLRRIKRLVRPGLGFGAFETATRTLAGCEAMAMIGKGQAHNVGDRDMRAQATFVAGLSKAAS